MRRLCRFTAGFSIGCAACVAHFRSGAYLLAAIAAALCVLAVGASGSSCICSRLLPALLGLSLALAWCGVYRAVLLRRLRRSARGSRQRFRRRFWNIRQARAMDVPFLFAWRQSPGVSARCFITRPMRRFCPATASRARQSARGKPDNLERDEYYASRGVWMCASAKGELTVEARNALAAVFPSLCRRAAPSGICTQIFPADAAGFLQALLTGVNRIFPTRCEMTCRAAACIMWWQCRACM